MGEKVKALYLAGQLTTTGLGRAVGYGWITGEQYTELCGEAYEPPQTEASDMAAALELLGVEAEEGVENGEVA